MTLFPQLATSISTLQAAHPLVMNYVVKTVMLINSSFCIAYEFNTEPINVGCET